MRKFEQAKEMTLCDVCGNRLVIPPGVIYRGLKMHKQEASRKMREDMSTEEIAPRLDAIEKDLQDALDVEEVDE